MYKSYKPLLEKNLEMLKKYLPSVIEHENNPEKVIITCAIKENYRRTLPSWLSFKMYQKERVCFYSTDKKVLFLEQQIILWYDGVLNKNEDMLELAKKLDSDEIKVPKNALKKSRKVGVLADSIEILKEYLSLISQCDNIHDENFNHLKYLIRRKILREPTSSKNYTSKALSDLDKRIILWYDGVLNKNEDMLELAKKLDSPGIRLYVKQNISFRKKDCQPKNDNNKSTVNFDDGYLYNDNDEEE